MSRPPGFGRYRSLCRSRVIPAEAGIRMCWWDRLPACPRMTGKMPVPPRLDPGSESGVTDDRHPAFSAGLPEIALIPAPPWRPKPVRLLWADAQVRPYHQGVAAGSQRQAFNRVEMKCPGETLCSCRWNRGQVQSIYRHIRWPYVAEIGPPARDSRGPGDPLAFGT